MIGDAVDPQILPAAMAMDGAANNGTRMLGPLVGGALYQTLGPEGVYACGVVLFAAAFVVATTIKPTPTPATPPRLGLARLTEPFRQVRAALDYALARPDVRRILLVTIVFNVWAFPYTAMIPVIGRDTLGLAAGTVGALAAIEGLFALAGALVIAHLRRSFAYRRLYTGAVFGLLATILVVGLFTSIWTVPLGLAVGGLCAAGFAAMQSTLIYVVAPPAMRGRFLGLMTICIGAGLLGFANVGITAELVGATNALWIIALEGLVALVLVVRRWPELREQA
jgi:predicted MFS family arabinose efflux permease